MTVWPEACWTSEPSRGITVTAVLLSRTEQKEPIVRSNHRSSRRRLQTHGCCVYIFTCCRYIFLLLSSTCCSVLLCSSSQMLLSSLTLSGEWRSFTLSSKWVLGVCVCLCVHVFVLLKLWGYKSVYTVTSWRQVRASKARSTCLMKSKNKHRLRHKMKPIPLLSSKTVFCHKNS